MGKRILVIEDQPDNRKILRDLLTSADFEVFEAEDGEEGVAAAAAQRPDLILMDIQLPLLDGYEAIPGSEWAKAHDPKTANRAVKEYLATLDDAAFGAERNSQ